MSSPPKTTAAELLTLWGIQETLLQQYRTMFITMHSIFIAVAGVLLQSKEPWIPMTMLTFLAIFAFWLWLSICKSRGETVFMVHYLLLLVEQGVTVTQPLKALKDFQLGHRKDIENSDAFKALHSGTTRWKMEKVLPSIFAISWLFLWAIVFLQHYNVALVSK